MQSTPLYPFSHRSSGLRVLEQADVSMFGVSILLDATYYHFDREKRRGSQVYSGVRQEAIGTGRQGEQWQLAGALQERGD